MNTIGFTPAPASSDVESLKTHGVPRSPHWPTVRKEFLEKNPHCAVCGGKEMLEVHHVQPFHLHPALELDPTNFITLCEKKHDGVNCHLLFGHLGCFSSVNVTVRDDASHWSQKIATRPK